LIRAYGGAARLVLRESPVETVTASSIVRLTVDAANIGAVYDVAARMGGGGAAVAVAGGEEYGEDGSLSINLSCETSFVEQLKEGLRDSTKGSVVFKESNDGE